MLTDDIKLTITQINPPFPRPEGVVPTRRGWKVSITKEQPDGGRIFGSKYGDYIISALVDLKTTLECTVHNYAVTIATLKETGFDCSNAIPEMEERLEDYRRLVDYLGDIDENN